MRAARRPGSDRVATIVHDHGAPVAAILHDASLEDERELIDAVGAAASITLENERLDAELRAKIEELSEQRRRGVVAALEERRRLERNLHDGAQQRLVSMALKLRLARGRLRRPRARGPDAGRRGRGAGLRARGAARAGPRHPPGRAERPRPRRGAGVAGRRARPLPVEVEATPGERLPEAGGARRLLRGGRGADQRGQVLVGHARRSCAPCATMATCWWRSQTTAWAEPTPPEGPG